MRKLEKKLSQIPSSPGVYLFKGKTGRVLYVGKAANLRVRVRSYFRSVTSHHPVKKKLLEEIADVETRQTDSEIEALVTEAQLIKKLKPRFNVLMRDNKNYSYVGFTREDYPRITITHQPVRGPKQESGMRNQGRMTYLGPYTEVKPLKRTLRLLRQIFPYYARGGKQSSVERQMGLVPAENIAPKEYKKNVRAIKSILSGRKKSVIKNLKKEIKKASRVEDFERAKILKDQLEQLVSVMEHARVLGAKISAPAIFVDTKPNFKTLGLERDPERIEAYDISNIGGKEAVGSMIVFQRSSSGSYEPNKNEYRKFKIKTVSGANDPAMMKEVLIRRMAHLPRQTRVKAGDEWSKPDLIVVDGGKAQLNVALRAVENSLPAQAGPIRVIALAKRQEDVYLAEKKEPIRADQMGQATKHLLQALRDETHRFAISYHRKLHRKKVIDQ